jgi:hypothetical protein
MTSKVAMAINCDFLGLLLTAKYTHDLAVS